MEERSERRLPSLPTYYDCLKGGCNLLTPNAEIKKLKKEKKQKEKGEQNKERKYI